MKKLINVAVVICMSLFVWACSSNSGGGGGGSTFTPVIDLAVADLNGGFESVNAFEDYSVFIYTDVLNNPDGDLQDPAVTLDTTNTGLTYPRNLLFSGDDLVVVNCGASAVMLFRGYRDLSDGAAPDVILSDDGGGADSISCAKGPVIGNDILIVPDESNSEVYLWDAQSAITTDDTLPTVVLDTATSLINSADGIYYDDDADQLWVANWTSTAAEPCVSRFDDVEGIVAGGVAVAPDNVLSVDPSFLTIGECRRVLVDTNTDTLFVATNSSGTGGEDVVYMFENASGFSDDDLPVAVIAHTGTQLLNPLSMVIHNNHLFVTNRNTGDEDECKNLPGLVGFSLDNLGALQSGQAPSVNLGGTVSGVAGAQEVRSVGGFLFTAAMNACQSNEGFGDVKIFSGGPSSGDSPFMTLPALKDFATAAAVDAILVQ